MAEESFAEIVAREGFSPRGAVGKSVDAGANSAIEDFAAQNRRAENRGGILPPDFADSENFMPSSEYAASGFDRRRLRDLSRQEPEAALDLHGMTAAEAHSALDNFLRDALSRGRRHLEIIHGRGEHSADGRAILRVKTRKWLAACNAILGFAEPPHNPGALRVRLRRAK